MKQFTYAQIPMKILWCLLVLFAIACGASCVPEGSSTQRAHTADNAVEYVDTRQSASPEVIGVDLSERTDWKLEGELKNLRQKTQPIIVDLTWSNVGSGWLKPLHGLQTLRGLCLFGAAGVSDNELQHLDELPNLEFIDLGGCNVTTEGILLLRSSRELKRLGLADVRPPLDDNAIERIVSAWPNLESISLDGSQITDAGLSHLGELRRLRYLNVSRTQIADKGLESLASLSGLTTLHASNTNIGDQGMAHLARITSLEKLDLNFTGITDRGLKEVHSLTNLKRIYFVGTKVTDDGLEYLKPLKTIEFVGPSETISSGALEALKESLPRFKMNKRG